jgi:hypothetical protein
MTITDLNHVRRSGMSRMFAVLLHPRAAFTEMASESRATWLTPMLVLTVTAILVTVTAGYIKSTAALMGEAALPPDWQYWTPEMQENYMQAQQATQGPVFVYVLPLLGSLTMLWLGWFIYAGLLHLGSTLFGGRGSMQNALNLVAWSSLTFALRDILRILFMLVVQHVIVSPGLSGFFTNSAFLSKFFARIDLFMIWFIVLLAIGLTILDKLPVGKSVANVLIVILLILLIQAGLSTLVSNIGGGAAQRPFF